MDIKQIGLATAVAGILDISSAAILTATKGGSVIAMLQSVGSGPFGDQVTTWGVGGAMVGLATHFTIMLIMVVIFAKGLEIAGVSPNPLIIGPIYGLLLYAFMYWVVMRLRWPETNPAKNLRAVLVPIAIHILLVGLPIAWIVRPEPRTPLAEA